MKRAILIAVVVLVGSVGGVFASEAIDKVLGRFEKQTDRARQTYERALQTASDSAIRQLATIGKRAVDAGNDEDAADAYKEILRLNRNYGQARAYFSERGTLEQTLTQLTREWTPAVLPGAPKWEEQVFYETMLGTYDGGAKPVVNLVVPNGGNTFTSHTANIVRLAMAGEGDPKVGYYEGKGMIVIPKEGQYAVTAVGDLYIDGNHFGRPETGDPIMVPLTKGLHRIRIREGYHLRRIILEVRRASTQRKVPVFNSLADIKTFLSTPLAGRQPVEVSGWDPDKARPLRIELPDR